MNKPLSGIYSINSLSGKRYIGSAVNLNKRLTQHLHYLRNNKHYNQYLQRTWNKYGGDTFYFLVMLFCDMDNLLFYEQRVIDYYKNSGGLFNVCLVAGSGLGSTRSEETRRKMSISNIGKIHSEETKKKLSLINIGKVLSDGTKEKMRIRMIDNKYSVGNHCRKGMKLSDEVKMKISKTLKEKNIRPPLRTGSKLSECQKDKLRTCLLGNTFTLGHKLSDEHKQKISMGNKGKIRKKGHYHHPPEVRAKLAVASKGNKYSVGVIQSEETRAKRSKALKGRVMSEETKAKISNTLRGHPVSNETRKKMSERQKGKSSPKKGISTRPHSEEEKMKISNSMRRYCEAKRQEAVTK